MGPGSKQELCCSASGQQCTRLAGCVCSAGYGHTCAARVLRSMPTLLRRCVLGVPPPQSIHVLLLPAPWSAEFLGTSIAVITPSPIAAAAVNAAVIVLLVSGQQANGCGRRAVGWCPNLQMMPLSGHPAAATWALSDLGRPRPPPPHALHRETVMHPPPPPMLPPGHHQRLHLAAGPCLPAMGVPGQLPWIW